MRSYDANDEYERLEMARLNAEPWMVKCLAFNPDYPHWGPHEDYMIDRREVTPIDRPDRDDARSRPVPRSINRPHGLKDDDGWSSPVLFPSWCAFGPWKLDDWNEVVHFYFTVSRATERCDACAGSGYNPATHQLAEDFYDFAETGRKWSDKITQDEADALITAGRLWDFYRRVGPNGWEDIEPRVVVTAEMVNAANRAETYNGVASHDGINRHILIETRAKRLGVWGKCETCEGHGHVFTEPTAKLGLVLWVLHPRKGASRGVEVESIERADLPAVFAFLREAANRNAERFANIPSAES